MYRIGLIINPLAGVGGAVGLKGSDGDEIVAEAFRRGATAKAAEKAQRCLTVLEAVKEQLEFVCCPADMGEDVLSGRNFSYSVLSMAPIAQRWSGEDTEHACRLLISQGVDLILFVGGDGTARNIVNALGAVNRGSLPVMLGIPAGVKIHSGVYGVTPEATGRVVLALVRGEIVSLVEAEVRDIDEVAFRDGRVKTRFYGELLVPTEAHYMQHTKNSGREVEALVLQDIAEYVIENMVADEYYVFAPGSTTQFITNQMGIDSTLLGVDVVSNQTLVAKDIAEQELFQLIDGKPAHLVVTVIGGQGHILGRGNQQLSARVIRAIGRERIIVVSTKSKLKELNGRSLLVDSGDFNLDQRFNGFITVITGYNDKVLYPIGYEI